MEKHIICAIAILLVIGPLCDAQIAAISGSCTFSGGKECRYTSSLPLLGTLPCDLLWCSVVCLLNPPFPTTPSCDVPPSRDCICKKVITPTTTTTTTTTTTPTTTTPTTTTTTPTTTTPTTTTTTTTTTTPTTTTPRPVCCTEACCSGQKARNSARVYGGQLANSTAWPSIVAVATQGGSLYSGQYCAGTLLDSCHVLSAASCFQGSRANPTNVYIGAGVFDLNANANNQLINVASISNHESYAGPYLNDISVLRLANCVNFTNYNIRPICLPPSTAPNFVGATATVAGWGLTESGYPYPIYEANLTVNANPCGSATLPTSQLCAGSPGKDACPIDSGGPLVYKDPETGTIVQIGIVPSRSSCSSSTYEGVYTRVSYYLDWIAKKTADGCCF